MIHRLACRQPAAHRLGGDGALRGGVVRVQAFAVFIQTISQT